MKRRPFFIGLAISILVTGSVFAQTLGAVLSASQEVPPCSGSGFGNATVTFDSTRANINVTITVSNLGSPISIFHIHEGAAGVGGPVVVNLVGLGGTFTNGTMTGTFPIPSDVMQRMLQNPGNFYVNVHTNACPGGATRGQLAYVSGGPVLYASELRGANETPPNSSTAFGSSLVTFDPINNTLAFEVNTSGIASPTASHIHRGASGVGGPVIINFAPVVVQFQGGRVSGSGAISALQSSSFLPSDLTALASASTANGYYVNVHSTAFGGGEIRGQLVPAQELDIPIAGKVTNGLGQTFITDARVFNPSFDTPTTALIEFFPVSTTANANADKSFVVNLPARGTAVLNDVASTGLNTTGIGAIRITSVANLVATSRIFVNTPNGSFGQFVPVQNRSAALRRGVMPQVSNSISAISGFRANVGFFNPNPGSATVRLEARDSNGAVIASNLMNLAGLSAQLSSIGTYLSGVSNIDNLTLSFDASAPIFVFVSEVDNQSGDSFLVPALPDTGVAASQ